MNSILNAGRFLYAIPMVIFGLMHFMAANDMAAMAPGGVGMVYFTGVALIAAGVAIMIRKYDKLASTLLAVMLLLFIIPHAQGMADNPMEMGNILKNIAMAGGALMAGSQAGDDAVIG